MSRFSFWMIWLVGGGPLLVAIVLYFSGAMSGSGTQRGELLAPGQSLQQWGLTDLQGAPLAESGQWQVLLTTVENCTERCQWWQQQLGQVHKALGKERGRVDWRVISESDGGADISNGIWIADPLGNLVMRYQFDQPPQDLLKDLRRLLKVSRIG